MTQIRNNVAVITGAASGIGASLALEMATRGAALALADIDEDGLETVRKSVEPLGVECSTHVVDTSRREAVDAFAADVDAQHGRAGILVNNAGVTLIETAERTDPDDFEWIMGINFWGVVNGCQAFMPYLRRQQDAHIVNVSSLFGLVGIPMQSAYNASKFAVRGYTEALRVELDGSPISVTCVHPGGVKTAIVRNARFGADISEKHRQKAIDNFDRKAMTESDKAGEIIANAVARNRRRVLVGPDARIGDLLARLLPSAYDRVLRLRKMMPRGR